MTAKQTAATAWDNMKSFDWALHKNSTETKFEQFVIITVKTTKQEETKNET